MKKTIVTEEYDGAGVLKKRTITTEEETQEYPWYTQPYIAPVQPQPVFTPWRPNFEIICGGTVTLNGSALTVVQ